MAKEARKIFARYKMLGNGLDIVHTLKTLDIKTMDYVGKTKGEEEVKIPIPFKFLGMCNSPSLVPENMNKFSTFAFPVCIMAYVKLLCLTSNT